MPGELVQYITTQQAAGYNERQIRLALSQQYTEREIDAAFYRLHAGDDPLLIQRARSYAQQGMTPVQVLQALEHDGYSRAAARSAAQGVFGPGTLKHSHAIVFLVLAFTLAAGGLYFLLGAESSPNPSGNGVVDFSVSAQIEEVLAIANSKGKEAAVQECSLRLRSDNRDLCLLDVAILPSVADDALCDQVLDARLRDTCLLNFVDEKRDSVCARVTLRESIETCEALRSFTRPSA